MKTNKLMYLLVIGLALAITATGCNKKPMGVTPLPGVAGPRDEGMTGLPPSQPIPNPPEYPATQNIPPTGPAQPGEYNEEPMPAETIVHFNYDSAVVKNTEKAHVEAAVQALRADQVVKIRVEGHCDERGTEEYNRSLGERRALAIREAMVKLGIDPSRILTISYGKDRPVAPGHSEADWKQNRRGEFILLHPK